MGLLLTVAILDWNCLLTPGRVTIEDENTVCVCVPIPVGPLAIPTKQCGSIRYEKDEDPSIIPQ